MAGLGGSLGYVMGALDWGSLGKHDHHIHNIIIIIINLVIIMGSMIHRLGSGELGSHSDHDQSLHCHCSDMNRSLNDNYISATMFGGHIRLVFTLVLFIFLGCVGVTLTSFRFCNFHQNQAPSLSLLSSGKSTTQNQIHNLIIVIHYK